MGIKNCNQKIVDIRIFNSNDNYIEFDNGYAIDGAIQIYLSKTIIAFVWNFELENFEFQENRNLETSHFYEINLNNLPKIKNLIGQEIDSLKFIENEFHTLVDYTMKTGKIKLVSGIELTFISKETIKISCSNFKINSLKNIPTNISPDLQGNILIEIS
ncbi:hypothetical protein [uncultured Tenacibaculum sp.]|uniref:hypothetical protein n=1 Tax=uncultured Tenacibaculum sp. TaxID=174713 RepID=UPI0026194EC8|nr:hypothetical protein [uncultured Tenacibaculum sp.]